MMLADSRAAAVRRAVRTVLPWLLLVAVLVNVAMTIRFHSGTSHSIRLSQSGELAELIDTTYPEMRHEYGFYAELGRVASGSTLELPANHPLDLDRLRFLAGMAPVDGVWYPEAAATGLEPIVSAPLWVGDGLITYQIVAGAEGEPYGAVRSGDLLLVAPTRLLAQTGASG